jgi:HD-GYP domain-containing protein (c-di-GMP phosphodiesterase class II)
MPWQLRLRGVSGPTKGLVWEHPTLIRVGRLAQFELMLDDPSVSRRHAEVRNTDNGWTVTDVGSTNGTYINSARIGKESQVLSNRDILQFGKVAFLVEQTEATLDGPASDQLVMQASLSGNLDEGLSSLDFKPTKSIAGNEKLQTLLGVARYLIAVENEDQLLKAILDDAVRVLDAQRGAIVLANDLGELQQKPHTLVVGNGDARGRFHYSKRLIQRCFLMGESALYKSVNDFQDILSQSISDGAMSSVMTVLLRTPRRKLGVLHLDRSIFQDSFDEDDLKFADALAAQASTGIEAAFLLRKQREMFRNTMMAMAQLIELRDEYTGGHTERVTLYSRALGDYLNLSVEDRELIEIGTPLHDIGKIGIPDEILQKAGSLTPEEFATMQTHTTLGADALLSIRELHPAIPIVRNHHERWDGTGYPDRLSGENIPYLARIVAVADAFDAMTSDRPYHPNRKGRPPEDAFAEVARQAGRHFDPKCAEAFLAIRERIEQIMYEKMPQKRPLNPVPDTPAVQEPELTPTRSRSIADGEGSVTVRTSEL